jgi:hypothetical protein
VAGPNALRVPRYGFTPACQFNTILTGDDGGVSASVGEYSRNRPSALTS